MKQLIESATSQFQENDLLDFSKTEKLLNLHKDLYEKVKSEFLKTCKICYEINTIDSFCNCKVECAVMCLGCEEFSMFDTSIDCKNNGFNRTDLIQFMAIYENTEIKLKEDKLFFKNALDGCFNDDLIEQNNKTDLNKPAIITVQQFMKEQGYVSIHKTVRKNQEGLPYLTFIKLDNVAHNIYFSKEARQDKQAGQLLYKGFFDKLNVAEVTNADGEVRMKIIDESFDASKENKIVVLEQSQKIEKTEDIEKTVEEKEIDFIKELFLVIIICGLIVFLSITVIVGTFFRNNFFREALILFTSDEVSIEDRITGGGFNISIIVVILMLFLMVKGNEIKILKKLVDTGILDTIYVLIGIVLFGVVFWKFSVMLISVLAIVLVVVFLRFVILKIRDKINKL
ncbi:membrane hypothetical protein [Flavobacterium psychrophilum]|uniref:hypothetical protein n=1 Tax=Flavobacterium psychrophilum TaxID=96345 RepID=UPI000B7C1C5E|nr:hypothetical protein [Flavobacterium psychrophilum]SNB22510.1 membrane hypothetical protein [Flavobacterium psychrophilum]